MEIVKDIVYGFSDSLRLDLSIGYAYNNPQYLKIIKKLFKHNLLLHIIPLLTIDIINYLFQFSFHFLLYILNYPICIFSIFMHALIYIELALSLGDVIKRKKIKTVKSNRPFTDSITVIIMMMIYQSVVYLSTKMISIILGEKIYLLGLILNFGILMMYHSLYAYNNLWQVVGLDINQRITIHETHWAYFLGFGLVGTYIYMYTSNAYILAIYNIYTAILASMPILLDFDFRAKASYTKINLSVFSWMLKYILYLSKSIMNKN